MRKLSLLLAIAAFVSVLSTNSAQAQTDKQNAVKLGLLSPAALTGTIFYQRAFSEMISAELGFSYTAFKISGTKFTGLSFIGQFNLHPMQEGIHGFHVSPYFRYRNWSDDLVNSATFQMMEIGAVIGYQWVFGDLISLDLYGGPGYLVSNKVKGGGMSTEVPFPDFGFRFGITLGVAF